MELQAHRTKRHKKAKETERKISTLTKFRNVLLTLNLHLQICVAAEYNLTNRVGEILGFGETTEHNITMPCTLHRAYIQVFANTECKLLELPLHTPNPLVLCAGVIGGGVDSCQVRHLVKQPGLCSNDVSYSSVQ